jgi:hypothetical protein
MHLQLISTRYWLILTVLALALSALLAWQPTPVQADSPLPPRELPEPVQPHKDKPNKDEPVGAYIELIVPDAPGGAWAVVQWQDSAGGWQDVTGWQGPVASSRRWWVHPKDFGAGPFRWVVTKGPDGLLWAASASFNLPCQPNQTVQVVASPVP